ncbi:MAG: bifunctional phosphoglucose/phosphomannose isomerase [Flammeovirgaceae bacterium]
MRELFEGFSRQLRTAIEVASTINVTPPEKEIRNIVIAGLGGSGIGGTLAEAITSSEIAVPISITKSYDIPNFVNEHTLFVASSFSGNTEETLAAANKAIEKGAKFVAITTGGKMKALAAEKGFDCVVFEGEAPCPRQHFCYSLPLLLFTLKAYGLVNTDFAAQINNIASIIDANAKKVIEEAQVIAGQLHHKLPILYADTKFGGTLVRFQQQINENAKQLAHTNVFPEMNHNELVGWESAEHLLENSVVMMFRSNLEHERVKVRLDLCTDIFIKKADDVITLHAKGDNLFEQSLWYIYLTDWISFFLADLNGVDPFPVDIITFLKNELAKI